jgi:hypothetical protein
MLRMIKIGAKSSSGALCEYKLGSRGAKIIFGERN